MNYKILTRIIGILEQRRLKVWAFLGAFFIALSFFTIFKPYMGSLPLLNFQLSAIIDTRDQVTSNSQQTGEISKTKKFEPLLVPVCNFSGEKSDFCDINGDIRIHGNSSSIFFTSAQMKNVPKNTTIGIKLYARKTDQYVMAAVKEQKLKPSLTEKEMPICTVNYTIPAVVFNAGGYAGNLFHAISDVFIPLYLTSVQFHGKVQFLIEDRHSWWVQKFEIILKALSNYELIDLNRDTEIRCFKNVVVGVKAHKDFGIDPRKFPHGYTLRNFTQFIRKTFSLEREIAMKIKDSKDDYRKPRLLILARRQTRLFLNEDEVAAEAQSLGFDVEIIDARGNLIKDFSKMVNSFDVMIGVHGAGLTNMVFLPENAILIQVTPLALESVAKIFYERPARGMNLKYLEYKISRNESSLIKEYPVDHPVIVDPGLYKKQGWQKFKSIYLNQNVRLDVSSFRGVLVKALELLHQ